MNEVLVTLLASNSVNNFYEKEVNILNQKYYNPPAPQARGGLKENIQFFSYRLAKPSKPIFFPKVAKSEAN